MNLGILKKNGGTLANKVKNKKKNKPKVADILNMNRINPITHAMDKQIENLQNLKNKKVTIEVQSLYDQLSNQMIINEYISGKVKYVDTYGIMLTETVRKKYVNNKFQGMLHTPSDNCLVYHKIIRYIYLNHDVPVFSDKSKK